MRALKGSWLREEICPTLWQVEVWRLIAHIFVLGKSCQCRCPRRVSSSCPSWMGVKRLRSHAGTMKMELTLGVHCNGACSSCSPRAGLILCSRKGVKAAGKTGIDGRWGGGMSRPMTWRNWRRNGEEEDTWGGGKDVEEKSEACWRRGGRHGGRRRWKNIGMNLEKQCCMAEEQRGGKSEKQRRRSGRLTAHQGCTSVCLYINPHLLTAHCSMTEAAQKPWLNPPQNINLSKVHQPQTNACIAAVWCVVFDKLDYSNHKKVMKIWSRFRDWCYPSQRRQCRSIHLI